MRTAYIIGILNRVESLVTGPLTYFPLPDKIASSKQLFIYYLLHCMTLKYPYPYKAWLAIANDPDNTLLKDWQELDQFIWKELRLPIGNSLFIRSYNHNLKDQVNLVDHPEIAQQYHDTIHTWGDYMHSRSKGFDRNDAKEAMKILDQHTVRPKVWIDHAQFAGNLFHNSVLGSIPETKDRSGHSLKNFVYTLDLIEKTGIKYVWDGDITEVLGQDRPIRPLKFFLQVSTSNLKAIAKYSLYLLLRNTGFGKIKELLIPSNEQYFLHQFPDGRKFYCFRRYGRWEDADIYGLYNLIAPQQIDELIECNGSSIVYTHLGKRPANKLPETFHIPENTRESFKNLADKYESKDLMISPVSEMLDYLVLRDLVQLSKTGNRIVFEPDKIRYEAITQNDLSGKKFSFHSKGFNLNELRVTSNNESLEYKLLRENPEVFSIEFPQAIS